MDFTMVIPVLIAFVLSVAAGPVVIPVLRRLKMDQRKQYAQQFSGNRQDLPTGQRIL